MDKSGAVSSSLSSLGAQSDLEINEHLGHACIGSSLKGHEDTMAGPLELANPLGMSKAATSRESCKIH